MTFENDSGVIMALAPITRGFGYAVFESPELIMDFGAKDVRKNKLRDCLLKANVLMHMTQPSVLVLEDMHDESSRRRKRKQVLMDKIAELAEVKGVTVVRYSRQQIQSVFKRMGAHKKYDIARAVAKVVPELAPRLPPRRGYGDSEHHNMGMFEAAALALTHCASAITT